MRKIVGLVLVLAVLWAGWWVAGSVMVRKAAQEFFAQQKAAGRVAEYQGLSVRGFPNRFDLTVEEVRLGDPDSGFGWRAPFLQIFAMSWKPWHLIAAFPPEQRFEFPGQSVTVNASALRASLIVSPGGALALDRTASAGQAIVLRSSLGWTLRLDDARVASRRVGDDAASHEIGIDLQGLAPEGALAEAAERAGLPPRLSELRFRAVTGLTAPVDRHLGQTRPQLRTLDLRELRLIWGPLSLTGSGRLTVDGSGRPEGRIDLALGNWRQAIRIAAELGLIEADALPSWERALGVFAARSGGEELQVPLTMAEGWMNLGPLPLGPAPALATGG
ncbi:DUF2125 domain-containing protein [Rhodobacter sp. NSM]|uniref:DUF2125 domain-containing protein n=1 Tax=Rhodobacter sp. NSM TaxID=3457501 RepID=UPI003FD0A433